MKRSPETSDLTPALVIGGLVAICCGGPLLIAALAATGLGAVLVGQGAALLGLAVLAAVAAALLWLRRMGRIGVTRGGADCCAPTTKDKP